MAKWKTSDELEIILKMHPSRLAYYIANMHQRKNTGFNVDACIDFATMRLLESIKRGTLSGDVTQ